MITIDETLCIKCNLCANICMQSVLHLIPSGIKVEDIECVDCTECFEICPTEALIKEEEIYAS